MKIAVKAAPVYSADGSKLIGSLEPGRQVITLAQSGAGTIIAYILGLVRTADAASLVEQSEWEKNAGIVEKFLSYAASQVGCLYVSGAQGQTMTPALIRKLEKNDSNYKRALKAYNKHAAAGTTLVAYDCSGLVMAFIENAQRLVPSDKNANGIYYTLCDAVTENEIRGGDLVFKKNRTNSRMRHVGIYMGDGTVVHSKGRDCGVVRTPLRSDGWSRYGRLKCFKGAAAAATFYRVLRYMKACMIGDDVREVQKKLVSKGFDPKGTDGVFGPKTQAALMGFQKANGMEQDGTVTREVWDRLMA